MNSPPPPGVLVIVVMIVSVGVSMPVRLVSFIAVIFVIVPMSASMIVFMLPVPVFPFLAPLFMYAPLVILEIPVFAGAHKIHTTVTGMVMVTVAFPVSRVFRWYVQVDGFAGFPCFMNNDGFFVNDAGMPVTDTDMTIDAGRHFAGNIEPDIEIIGQCHIGGQDQREKYKGGQGQFHGDCSMGEVSDGYLVL